MGLLLTNKESSPLIFCRLCKKTHPDRVSLDKHIRDEHPGFVRCFFCNTILIEELLDNHRSS